MTLKGAAMLALIGTLLTTQLQAIHLVLTIMNILRGLVPAMAIVTSLLTTFASLTLVLFFLTFYRSQT